MAPDVHFQFTHISVDEVLQQLQRLDAKMDTVSDCVPAFFLKGE